nr:MAG TPA: cytidine deaminase-like protein [Caudoviricetes sp.]
MRVSFMSIAPCLLCSKFISKVFYQGYCFVVYL